MLIRSQPLFPSDRERLGDFALKQNQLDRSNTALNHLIDTRLRPAHQRWLAAFRAQERADSALEALGSGTTQRLSFTESPRTLSLTVSNDLRAMEGGRAEAEPGNQRLRESALQLRTERRAADAAWDAAYRAYHIAVEFEARGELDVIRRRILPWPPAATS